MGRLEDDCTRNHFYSCKLQVWCSKWADWQAIQAVTIPTVVNYSFGAVNGQTGRGLQIGKLQVR
jgi:hypothetical protein